MVKYKIEKKTDANQIGWIAPPIGWLKVNVDGSFVQDTVKGATWAIIRDHHGHVVAASGNILASCNSAECFSEINIEIHLHWHLRCGRASIHLYTKKMVANI
jgi:hypothetical protein